MALNVISEVAIKFPFSLDSLGNVMTTTDSSTIWADRVRAALSTRLGERVMRPSYGSNVSDQTFATSQSTTDAITKTVAEIFSLQLSMLSLSSVVPAYSEALGQTTITVTYQLPDKQTDTVQVGAVLLAGNNPPFEESL